MEVIALVVIAALAWRAYQGDAPVAGGGVPASGGSGEVAAATKYQSFAPVIAAEILRNFLLYEFEVVEATPGDQALGILRVHLLPRASTGKHGAPGDSMEDAASAFRMAAQLNAAGYAILSPVGAWSEQPWAEGNLEFAAVHKAASPEAMKKLASDGGPFALLVSTPGILSKYVDMPYAQVVKAISEKDVV